MDVLFAFFIFFCKKEICSFANMRGKRRLFRFRGRGENETYLCRISPILVGEYADQRSHSTTGFPQDLTDISDHEFKVRPGIPPEI